MKTKYSPFYFLAALGNGGLAISVFLYLMFMTPHSKTPIPTFDTISRFIGVSPGWKVFLISMAMLGIIYFAYRHFKLLFWNLGQFVSFKKSAEYAVLRNSNEEIILMVVPLTLAMTLNMSFAAAAVLIPGLWSVSAVLFPITLVLFTLIGIYAMKIFIHYFSRITVDGSFDFGKNNNLSQMIAIFAFSMIAVGYSAVAAMSAVRLVAILGLLGAIFFVSIAFLLAAIKLILGFNSILEHGISKESSPSIWIVIPILTIIGIALLRMSHSVAHHFFHSATPGIVTFIVSSVFLSIQFLFGLFGYRVLRKLGYFAEYISGEGRSPGSYSLICPGVAFFVFGMFFLNPGLVQNGVFQKFSLIYFILLAPLVFIQIKTVIVMTKLNRKLLPGI